MSTNKLKITSSHWVIVSALLISAVASFFLIQPYVNSIIFAFIISLLTYPAHQWIERKLTGKKGPHKNIAAVISCLILTVIILIPLMFVLTAILRQGVVFSHSLYDWGSHGGIQQIFNHPWVVKTLAFTNTYLPFNHINPQDIAQKVAMISSEIGTHLVSISAKIVGDATAFIINFFLMLFVMFFLLRDHEQIIQTLRHVLPLSRSQEDRLLERIEQVAKSAVMGSFLTAIAQGIAGGIGMALSGFPGLFWGTIIAFTSFIPIVGTAIIWIPASIYLILTGDTSWGIFLIVWSVAVVGSIDNLLRPFLMKDSAGMDTLLIFFSLIGGMHVFGLIGLIYGPLIFAITIVLFHIYEEEFTQFLDHQDHH